MIVLPDGDTLLLIRQADHAALAGRLMRAWRREGLPDHPRRAAVLHAVDEHDNGWRELDETPILDPATRGIADFITAPAELRQSVWPRGVARLGIDPWAAALVAEHACQIYARYRRDPGWSSFFETMARLRDEHTARAGGALDELSRDYLFLRVGDLISLAFCNRWTTPEETGAWTTWSDGADDVVVSPDPFEGATVSIEVPGRALPNRPFTGKADLDECWRTAPAIMLRGRARGRSSGNDLR